jgi:hypothetical protein
VNGVAIPGAAGQPAGGLGKEPEMADEQDDQQPDRTRCRLDIHREIWDLGGTMTAEVSNACDPTEPTGAIHEDETPRVRVTARLTGRILGYLCKTKIEHSLEGTLGSCPGRSSLSD